MLEQIKARITAAEFLAMDDRDELAQLIEGEIIVAPPPIPDHQRSVYQLAKVVESLMPNGEVFIAPIELALDDGSIPQPDVVWVAAGGRCIIEPKRLRGAPELIIEVLSPGTSRYDKIEKYRLYEKYAVREYWIADPTEHFVEVYVLDGEKYRFLGTFGADELFISPVLGNKTVELSKVFGERKG